MPEPHTLLIVVQFTEIGKPAPIEDCLAGACLSPAANTHPISTESTLSNGTCERSTAAFIAALPNSVDGTPEN